jgi:LPXTG-motif cell wall-anchored protein
MGKYLTWLQTAFIPAVGPLGLFLLAFLDSSFLSLPEINDLLVVAGSAAQPGRAWLFVVLTTLGSVAGCLVLWRLGRQGGEALLVRRFGRARMEGVRVVYRRWGILTLAIPALLPPPVPLKVFVFAAGAFGMSWRRFSLTVGLARGLRYSLWAVLGVVYGRAAVGALRHLGDWFALHSQAVLLASAGLLLLALGGWLRRKRDRDAAEPVVGV